MTTLVRPGVPVGGFKRVGQVRGTNNLVFRRDQNAMGIAVELLMTHTPGAPIVDERGDFVGFISEFDILRALEAGKDLNRLTAEDVMAKDRIAVTEEWLVIGCIPQIAHRRADHVRDAEVTEGATCH